MHRIHCHGFLVFIRFARGLKIDLFKHRISLVICAFNGKELFDLFRILCTKFEAYASAV